MRQAARIREREGEKEKGRRIVNTKLHALSPEPLALSTLHLALSPV